MIPFKVFSTLMFLFLANTVLSQVSLGGKVISTVDGQPIENVEVYNRTTETMTTTDASGVFSFSTIPSGTYELTFFSFEYQLLDQTIQLSEENEVIIRLQPLAETLSEVVLIERRERVFALRKLRAVEGTAIYSGKKNEVVVLENVNGNIAANNARQIYSQVAGLNIYDNGDAGLQLNIGGRGLDPNRTANFNTRQNGYDISADVLGYPESYYTPPPEALKEIQIIRGAASLQYGSQFGGLINFKFKEPNKAKPISLVSRQFVGSNNLFSSFNSLSGTADKFSYYVYFQNKQGDGFRPNSEFNAKNAFAHLAYTFNEQTKLILETTYFRYLAQQPGGLTDAQFYEDPTVSNRTRNFFEVDWLLYALRLEHSFSEKTTASLQLFGLDASRKAVGFRTNRVSQPDDLSEPRELLVDNFSNWGAEARVLHTYSLLDDASVLLLGAKYYQSDNLQQQGPGTTGSDANFQFATEQFPNYERQSQFAFPNRNLAIFGENIFQLSNKWSVTPGFRMEYIKTQSEGTYKNIVLDLAGNVLLNEEIPDNRTFDRTFFLVGVGTSFKPNRAIEVYGNVSQNYRSVTFNDIRVVNPSFQVDENISDEKGFTADLGVRGRWKRALSYDVSLFSLLYDDRLGEVLRSENNAVVRFRGNIGTAFILGVETFFDWNIKQTFFDEASSWRFNLFSNVAYTTSEYIESEEVGVEGNEVEFIPKLNIKTGLKTGYKNALLGVQFTYLSSQFTDATNAPQDVSDNQRGIEGSIPAYDIVDVFASYRWRNFSIETGIDNALNKSYFTRRATGYPGPGIIPAPPRTWYAGLQITW